MTEHRACCLCGDLHVTATASPLRTGVCHCKDCQKHHGTAFYAAAIFPQDNVKITGETRSYKGRHFCPRCGSSVFARTGDEIEIHLGAMDTPTDTPSYELWTMRRFDWVAPITGAHQSNRGLQEEA